MSTSYTPTTADYDALVSDARARSIDPLDVTELLWIESAGFDPASMGPGKDGAVSGLNQMSKANLASLSLTPAEWTSMSAAQQLALIFPFWDSLARSFNGGKFPADGPNLLALNFLPDLYRSSGAASNPDAVMSKRGDAYYAKNTFYDPANTGTITVNTIRAQWAQQRAAGGTRWAQLSAGVNAAIARASGTLPAPSSPASSSSSATTMQAGVGFAVILAIIVSAVAAALRGAR